MTLKHSSRSRGGLYLDDIVSPVDLDILKYKLGQARARQEQDTDSQIEAGEEAEYQVFKSLMRICDTDSAHRKVAQTETQPHIRLDGFGKVLSVME